MAKTFPLTIKVTEDEARNLILSSLNSERCLDATSLVGKLKYRARKDLAEKMIPGIEEDAQIGIQIHNHMEVLWKSILDENRDKLQAELRAFNEKQHLIYDKWEKIDEKAIQKFLDKYKIKHLFADGRGIISLKEAKENAKWEAEHLGCTDHRCWNTHKPEGCEPKGVVKLISDYRECKYFSRHHSRAFLKLFPEFQKEEVKHEKSENTQKTPTQDAGNSQAPKRAGKRQ